MYHFHQAKKKCHATLIRRPRASSSPPWRRRCPGSPARAPELANVRLHAARAQDEGTVQGCTLFTLEHRQRVAWLQTLSKQQHEFLRTQCGGTIARVLSEPVTKLVLAYTQIIRPAHVCTCLASSARASAPTPPDTAFLGCTTRGRIRPRQLRRAWQREWEHFASCWAASAAPPMSLTFSAYRHVAVALQHRACFCPVPQHQQQCTHLNW